MRKGNLLFKKVNTINYYKTDPNKTDLYAYTILKYINYINLHYKNNIDLLNNIDNLYVLICNLSHDNDIKQNETALEEYADEDLINSISLFNYLALGLVIGYPHPDNNNELFILFSSELLENLNIENIMIHTLCINSKKKLHVPINYFKTDKDDIADNLTISI